MFEEIVSTLYIFMLINDLKYMLWSDDIHECVDINICVFTSKLDLVLGIIQLLFFSNLAEFCGRKIDKGFVVYFYDVMSFFWILLLHNKYICQMWIKHTLTLYLNISLGQLTTFWIPSHCRAILQLKLASMSSVFSILYFFFIFLKINLKQ